MYLKKGLMNILGYTDKFSYKVGEKIPCKVSSINNIDYKVDLVKIIQGDINSKAPGYKVKKIKNRIFLKKTFKGRHQVLRAGSYGQLDMGHKVNKTKLLLKFNFLPTLNKIQKQELLCSFDKENYFSIFLIKKNLYFSINENDYLISKNIIFNQWNNINIKINKKIIVSSIGSKKFTSNKKFKINSELIFFKKLLISCGKSKKNANFFNGKISNIQIIDLTKNIFELNLDFSKNIDTQNIKDTSRHKIQGKLYNHPARGIKGPINSIDVKSWSSHPDEYNAIHFHEDDITDAKWKDDFIFTIPKTFISGVYAFRLYINSDNEFFVPFVILPKQNSKNKLLFLLPTASYLAYANNRLGIDVSETELVTNRLIEISHQDHFLQENPELGLSFYDVHTDNSGVYYSSKKRPIIDFQPKFIGKLGGKDSNVWQFNADTHILGWFDHFKLKYDVVTDHDIHSKGHSILKNYKTLVTGTHPEYYSLNMLNALQTYVNNGGRIMYLGGNGFYWRISFDLKDNSVIECRKSEGGIRAHPPKPGEYFSSTTGEYSGLWRNNGKPPNELVGIGMVSQGFDYSAPYYRTKKSYNKNFDFIFKDMKKKKKFGDFGLSGHGAAGLELDAVNNELGTPSNTHILAYSKDHSDIYLLAPEEILDPVPGLGGSENERIQSNVVIHQNKKFGGFFSVGSIAWAGSMAWNNYRNEISQLTLNVLKRFLSKKKFMKD